MKKISLLIFLALACITVKGQEIATIDKIKYYLENGEATIMAQDKSLSGDIIIPENLSYNNAEYKVTSVDASAFTSTKITSITLPNSITSLGEKCFEGCRNLTSITLPNSITSLGDGCFSYCGLTSITLPNSITSLGEKCFNNCQNLTSITLPNSITSLGDGCFSGCISLSSVTLPNSITSLGNGCFSGCISLSSVTLPNSITSLGNNCFLSCGLTSITLPNSITSLGDGCFSGCISLSSVTLPNSITSLGDGCFDGCMSLSSVTLPNSITSLGEACFSVCLSLTSITLPISITSLGDFCFNNCQNLTSITLPNSITSLGDCCFNNCQNLLYVDCNWTSFDGINISSKNTFHSIFSKAKLYVPKGTKELYSSTEPWKSSFNTIIEKDSEGGNSEVKVCTIPTIEYVNGELNLTSETAGAEYHYTIEALDAKKEAYSENGKIALAAKYNITVWASADGYSNSEKATATLYFIDGKIEGETGIVQVPAQRGIVAARNGATLSVSGLSIGETVSVYNLQGGMLDKSASFGGTAQLNIGGSHETVIIKVGEESIKVAL